MYIKPCIKLRPVGKISHEKGGGGGGRERERTKRGTNDLSSALNAFEMYECHLLTDDRN